MTWQTNLTDTCRSYFALRGKLGNATGPWVVPINNSWPVMAYALDLGKITRTSNPLVFGMGLIRNPVVSYRTGQTTKNLSHLWHARWSDIGSAVGVRFEGFLIILTMMKRSMIFLPLTPLPLLEPMHSMITFNSTHRRLLLNLICQSLPQLTS